MILWNILKYFNNSFDVTETDSIATFIKETCKCNIEYEEIVKRINNIKEYRKQLEYLLTLPQVAQRSEEWYELRRSCLTASSIAQAVDKGKYGSSSQLKRKKAFPEEDIFVKSPPLEWGIRFEQIASRSYKQRNKDIKLYEFGMLRHPSVFCFGASPDNISELGIMVEYKCPYKRKINGAIPEEYLMQMQGQMAVCCLKECDYVECEIDAYYNDEDYCNKVDDFSDRDHGIVIERFNNDDSEEKYIYSPEYLTPVKCIEWLDNEKNKLESKLKIHYWKLRKINIMRVNFDEKYWNELLPKIIKFWGDVEDLKKTGKIEKNIIDVEESNNKKNIKYDFLDDDDDTGI